MALILTPGQFNDRADFYHQCVSLLSAGYGLIQVLEHLRDRPPSKSYVRPLTDIIFHLQEGETFAQAIQHQGKWIPEFDAALLEAGELSGRLDHCMRILSNYYKERAELLKSVIGALIYPILLLHAAVFLIAVPRLILTFLGNAQGDGIMPFLMRTVGVLAPIYAVVFVGIYFSQSSRAQFTRRSMERVLNLIPIIGTARSHLALARLAMGLEALLNAGVIVTQAWVISARASGSFRIDNEVSTWPDLIEGGAPPSELMRNNRAFPDVFANLYATGEASGRLDDHLQKLHEYYLESGTSKLRQVGAWFPRLVYLAVVIYIAYYIISFYTGYFKTIGEISDF